MNSFKKTVAFVFLSILVFVNVFVAAPNLVQAAESCELVLELSPSQINVKSGDENAQTQWKVTRTSATLFCYGLRHLEIQFKYKSAKTGSQYSNIGSPVQVGSVGGGSAKERTWTGQFAVALHSEPDVYLSATLTGETGSFGSSGWSAITPVEAKSGVTIKNESSNNSGSPCTLRIFFRHKENGANVDEGPLSNIKVGETKYQVIGKIDNPGCDTSYYIRMTASDEKGQFPTSPALSIQHPVVIGHEYSITPNFSKAGQYQFYLDYAKDDKFTEAKQNTPALAATVGTAPPANGPYIPPPAPVINASLPPGGYDNTYGGLDNLIGVNSIPQFMAYLIKLFIAALGVWAVVYILVGAYRIVMSQGNTEALTKAKSSITWAIIGLTVAVLAYSIVAILQTVLGV